MIFALSEVMHLTSRPDWALFIIVYHLPQTQCNNMTMIKQKVSINWQKFKGRILIHWAVGNAAVCNELY